MVGEISKIRQQAAHAFEAAGQKAVLDRRSDLMLERCGDVVEQRAGSACLFGQDRERRFFDSGQPGQVYRAARLN